MSKEEEELRKLLLQVTANDVLFPAVVTSVDYDEDICDVSADGDYTDVKLRAVIDTTGNRVVVYPKVDSVVLCGRITNSNSLYVIQFSEIDKIVIVIGNTKVVLTDGLVEFNEGINNSGMAIVPKLIDHLNNLETAFNNLLNAYNSHTHILTLTSGTGTAAPTTSNGGTAISEDFGDIDDDKIKH